MQKYRFARAISTTASTCPMWYLLTPVTNNQVQNYNCFHGLGALMFSKISNKIDRATTIEL